MKKNQISPLHIMMVIGIAIFLAEFVVMLILGVFGPFSFYFEAILDASLLSIFLLPVFYFLIIRHPVYIEPLAGTEKVPSPVNALVILTAAIFFSELLMMIVLDKMPPMPSLVEAVVDSFFLLLITIPFLYHFLFLPLVRNIALLKDAERRLWEANVHLEDKVEERITELRKANVDLEAEISERIKAEEDLRREKERAQKYLDMAGVMFLVLDMRGTILMVNRKGCAILGCEVGNIIGQNWFDTFVPEEEKEQAKVDFKKLIGETGTADPYAEGGIVTRSGEKRFIGWHASRLSGGNRDGTAILLAGEDITNMKLNAQMLLRTEKLASIGTLSAGVAHEILNPLNIISTIAQLNLLDNRTGVVHDHFNEILAQVKRATKITNNLRMFAHQKKGESTILNVNNVIDKALLLVEHDLMLDNIKVVRDYQKDLPFVEADEDKLMQVFINLTTNSRDALEKKKGAEITIATRGLKDAVEIRFADNGPGISPELADRIFDPFFTTKDPNKGTGLGLSVVHTIIQNHFGHIHAEGELGKGACFMIRLPFRLPTGSRNETGGAA